MIDLSTLNGNQRRAVEWDDGPLLVLAGPGSGKTRVLTYRIARLIESTPDKHFKVLALTFTNAAAAEMRQRLLDLIPNASQRVLSSTFHSFSADILRQHGSHVGLKPDFTLLSQNEDRQFLLNDALSQCDDTDLGPRVSKDRLLDVISYLIESSISPEDSTAELLKAGIVKADVISDVYEKYRSTMIARNLLDFPSLIAETLSLLRMQRGVQRQIQRIYPYICVDEFQDTNSSQASLLELLINDSTKNVFVAADDDQIIYQWNGASPQRIKEIQTRLNMGVVQLPQNYRCPPEVVDLANRLIANNYERSKDKQPLTAFKIKSEMSAVRLLKFPNVESEVGWIASDIYNRDVASRAKCIVLARTRAMLDTAVAGLNQAGLPGFLATKKNEFESASIQWLHSVLRLANAPASREQLKRVCLSYYTLEGINIEVGDVLSQAVADDGNLLRAWGHLTVRRLDQNSQAKSLLEKSLGSRDKVSQAA